MLQAPKPLCLIQFWSCMISPFQLMDLWGNKNWPPSMKLKKVENFWNKKGFKGCKWSGLNVPGTEKILSYPLFAFKIIPFSHYWSSGVIRNGSPVWKCKSCKIFRTKGVQRDANGPVWMPQALKPSVSSTFGVGRIPFSHYWPSGVIRIGLPVWRWKSCKHLETKVA